MDILLVILLALSGISLVGTVMQNKIRIWHNSQNMLLGCAGGLVSYFCGFPTGVIILITIICTIISWAVFKYFISNDIFTVKSEKLQNIIIFIAIAVIVFLPFINFAASDFIIFKDPIIAIGFLFIIITGIISIPKFINFIKIYNPDEFEDGEKIYIVDNFFENKHNSTEIYGSKKFYFESMHFIINKRCTVQNLYGQYIINLDGINYFITEKNGKPLNTGDIVKISEDNLNHGMIRKSTPIIVEKEND